MARGDWRSAEVSESSDDGDLRYGQKFRILDDRRVCWWERMPTAEMGCGTCDPKEAFFSFPFLPRQERGPCRESEAHGRELTVHYLPCVQYSIKPAVMLAACTLVACSCCPLGSSVVAGDWAIQGLQVVRSQESLPIGPRG